MVDIIFKGSQHAEESHAVNDISIALILFGLVILFMFTDPIDTFRLGPVSLSQVNVLYCSDGSAGLRPYLQKHTVVCSHTAV